MTTEPRAAGDAGRRPLFVDVCIALAVAVAVSLALRFAPHRQPRWLRSLRERRHHRAERQRGRILHDVRVAAGDDVVLADRVRSSIGPLLHELDLPRVHVMAEGDRVLLHGDVDSDESRLRIEEAVRAVSGVGTVASYLHVGLLHGDVRPSSARHDPSAMARRFHDELEHRGITGRPADLAIAETLRLWLGLLPDGERAHVMAHVPDDVRSVVEAEPRHARYDRVEHFCRAVRRRSGLTPAENDTAVRAIVHQLKVMVPEECDDVAAVLPPGLAELWA